MSGFWEFRPSVIATFFEKGKRKYSTGVAKRWSREHKTPMIDVIFPSYFKAEAYVVGLLDERLNFINRRLL
ncbi:hypothetical protein [Bradyrhizobium sp.]|uniref:hypothetical protein n=1 Tax=Bradyrhizobium sp. TaxID=376 RepID=UPI0025C47736|nr:hypothetical protein [Bradyrhizobium sp.]